MNDNIPVSYDYMNYANWRKDPSVIHCKNTALFQFFKRYLLQDVISQFEWEMPESWDRDYFLYILYCWGFLAIFETAHFGVIPQNCGFEGYDVFYRPAKAIITNPLFDKEYKLTIDEECVVLKLQPDYGGCMDLVEYYANLLAICSEAISVNIFNTKLAYVFRAKDKTQAESFKKMYDSIASGKPAVFIDKNLNTDVETESWDAFTSDLKNTYVASDILADMNKLRDEFHTAIGIPNANTDKKERLISDEVNQNNFATRTKAELWLESLKKGCDKANTMFEGLNLTVDFRAKPEEMLNVQKTGDRNE